MSISWKNGIMLTPQKSKLVQVMDWCRNVDQDLRVEHLNGDHFAGEKLNVLFWRKRLIFIQI